MLAQEIIRKKRDGLTLTKEEIDDFVQGVNDWSIADGQIAAMMVALMINGMTKEEIVNCVRAITDTGMVLDWESAGLNGPVAGFVSTPRVGDKLEIIIPPVLAACGLYVPMVCERMMYHTGGTSDKLDSIRGFASHPTLARFRKTVCEAGCAFVTPVDQIAPADARIQTICDITATVGSLPLTIMSLLTKKVAAGIKKMTVDLNIDSSSFIQDRTRAEFCAKNIEECASEFGIETQTVYSEVDHILGQNVGNALEIYEIWGYLTGRTGAPDPEIHALVKKIGAAVLLQHQVCATKQEAEAKIERAITSGQAAERFGRMLYGLGVQPTFIDNPEPFLPKANMIYPVYPDREGYVAGMNLRWIGLAVIEMGAGRLYQEQRIDYAAGYSNVCRPGMYVSPRVPLAFVHAEDKATADQAAIHLKGAIRISDQPLS